MILTLLLLTTNFLKVSGNGGEEEVGLELAKLGEYCQLKENNCESGTKCKCIYLDSWGWTCVPKCQKITVKTTFSCTDATLAQGVGPVYRVDSFECQDKMQPKDGKPAQSFIYYEGSLHCQATNGQNARKDSNWKLCKPNGTISYQANVKASSGSNTALVVNVFAALGLSFTLYGAFRHYSQK